MLNEITKTKTMRNTHRSVNEIMVSLNHTNTINILYILYMCISQVSAVAKPKGEKSLSKESADFPDENFISELQAELRKFRVCICICLCVCVCVCVYICVLCVCMCMCTCTCACMCTIFLFSMLIFPDVL